MMLVEIQVALNFLISFLYNKLPRRRVNQFGEELENALKLKFEGHWYPEKPFKGSAFRCLKTTPPLDPVFEIAARESGMDLIDIQENLPQELSIWIDPGEVSYRMSEKGPVKILYSESDRSIDSDNPDREVIHTFNPEAQCFKPIETTAAQLSALSFASPTGPSNSFGTPSPIYKICSNNTNSFLPKSSSNVTFTTATFAQTKFGSTKLKSNSKRSHRMSPTEFSNYIKQRALLQQQIATQDPLNGIGGNTAPANNAIYSVTNGTNGSPQTPRSVSPLANSSIENANILMFAGSSNNCATSSSSVGPSSPLLSSMFGGVQTNHYSPNLVCSPPTARSNYPNGAFDSDHMNDFIGTSMIKSKQPASNQLQNNVIGRFSSLLDKTNPYIMASNATGLASNDSSPASQLASSTSTNFITNPVVSLSGLNGELSNNVGSSANTGKSYNNSAFNLNGVSYPNQYQHLLVAN